MNERGQYGGEIGQAVGGVRTSAPLIIGGLLSVAAVVVIARTTLDIHKHEHAWARWRAAGTQRK